MIRIGLIGIGRFGKNYLRLLQNTPDVELVTVAATSEKSFEDIELPVSIKKTTDVKEIFNDSEIDAVVIATPTETHSSLASQALQSGKHVLLEKPMVASLTEAETLAKIAEKSGKILMIGHQYLYNDYVRLLKEKLDQSFFGDIQYIYAEHFYTRPLESTMGCFWETATHELAILDYLFGQFTPEKKQVFFQSFFETTRDDFASVSFLLSGKIPVSITTSWLAPEKIRRFQIVGEKGGAVFDEVRDSKNPLRLYEKDNSVAYKEIPVLVANPGEPLQNEVMHFVNCIKEAGIPLTDYRHGLRITKYLDTLILIDK